MGSMEPLGIIAGNRSLPLHDNRPLGPAQILMTVDVESAVALIEVASDSKSRSRSQAVKASRSTEARMCARSATRVPDECSRT